jgi:Ca2+/Na+ antiporter
MGYGMMAFTACFAGQLFNLLIGFGISLVISSFKAEGLRVPF